MFFSLCNGSKCYFIDLELNSLLVLSKRHLLCLSRLWLAVCMWGTLSLQLWFSKLCWNQILYGFCEQYHLPTQKCISERMWTFSTCVTSFNKDTVTAVDLLWKVDPFVFLFCGLNRRYNRMGTVHWTWEFSLAVTHVEQQGGGGKWAAQAQYAVLLFKKPFWSELCTFNIPGGI